jgi:hypothetical protein
MPNGAKNVFPRLCVVLHKPSASRSKDHAVLDRIDPWKEQLRRL